MLPHGPQAVRGAAGDDDDDCDDDEEIQASESAAHANEQTKGQTKANSCTRDPITPRALHPHPSLLLCPFLPPSVRPS